MPKQVLFLTLRVFSATGGIEKVCKLLGLSLDELKMEKEVSKFKVFSMYDDLDDVNENYIPRKYYYGFGEKKFDFVRRSFSQGRKSDVVILSHINLLLIGFLIKMVSPKTKLFLFAHGIEVWEPLGYWRKYMLKRCDKILPVSNFTKDKMKEIFEMKEEKFFVFNNCLDPFLSDTTKTKKNEDLLASLGFSDKDFILLTLTRLSSRELYKGYDSVLIAISALKKNYPNIKYLIVGKYDVAEKERLDEIIKLHSLQGHVVFTGFIADEDLPMHYNLADLYIMPSKKEGFGIVFIEAMHYGLPVIAGNKDGSVDALLGGKLGQLVDPDNQVQINEAIEKLMLDTSNYQPNQILMNEHFGFDAYKNRLKAVLQNI